MGEISSETFEAFFDLWTLLIVDEGNFVGVARIRSNHGTEFENSNFNSFCTKNGIK